MTPAISIILPIFRVEKYLARCLDSVCAQTLQDIEIILATDGPDTCDDICRAYAAKDSRISVIFKPGGYGQAINQGLEAAKGKYIGIVETDDWLESFMLQKLYDMATRYDVDVCKGAFYHSFDDPRKNFTVYTDIPSGLFNLLDYPRILSYQPSVWSAIYKAEFIRKHNIHFMEERLAYLDTPFHLETFIKAERIAFVNEPLYHYYQDNPEQTVKSCEKPVDGILTEKHFYDRHSDFIHLPQSIYEALVLTATMHLAWNYDRLNSYANKQKFWKEAHAFIRVFSRRPVHFSEFNNKLTLFYRLLMTFPHHFAAEMAELGLRSRAIFTKSTFAGWL